MQIINFTIITGFHNFNSQLQTDISAQEVFIHI